MLTRVVGTSLISWTIQQKVGPRGRDGGWRPSGLTGHKGKNTYPPFKIPKKRE